MLYKPYTIILFWIGPISSAVSESSTTTPPKVATQAAIAAVAQKQGQASSPPWHLRSVLQTCTPVQVARPVVAKSAAPAAHKMQQRTSARCGS